MVCASVLERFDVHNPRIALLQTPQGVTEVGVDPNISIAKQRNGFF
jgi:hypothetical protein